MPVLTSINLLVVLSIISCPNAPYILVSGSIYESVPIPSSNILRSKSPTNPAKSSGFSNKPDIILKSASLIEVVTSVRVFIIFRI